MPMTARILHPMSKHPHPLRNQQGFTLLEILVAMVVLSIGLLGLAGLQTVSLNNNQVAYYRAIASQQTYDMADRMRANLAGVTAGSYDSLSATLPTDPDCISEGCTTLAKIRDTDHFQWLTNNAALLPNGSGTVTCCITGSVAGGDCTCNTANGDRAFEIAVTWTVKATNATETTETQSFVTKFAP